MVVGRVVGIVTLQAILDGGSVNLALILRALLIGMASEAERCRARGLQIHSGRIAGIPDQVAGQTPHDYSRMNFLSFCFVAMALETLGVVAVLIELNWVDACKGIAHRKSEE
jgi:hypothetical protein